MGKPIRLTDQQCRIFLREVRAFGYPSVTFDEVRKFADDYADGKEQEKVDVVDVMLRRQIAELEEAQP